MDVAPPANFELAFLAVLEGFFGDDEGGREREDAAALEVGLVFDLLCFGAADLVNRIDLDDEVGRESEGDSVEAAKPRLFDFRRRDAALVDAALVDAALVDAALVFGWLPLTGFFPLNPLAEPLAALLFRLDLARFTVFDFLLDVLVLTTFGVPTFFW